jgi:hypothetical protein
MAGATGSGTLTWSTLVGFLAEDGFTLGATTPEVKCTADTDTVETYTAGELVDNGQLTCTLILADGVDWRALVGTSSSLVHTNAHNDTNTGDAVLISGSEVNASNNIIKVSLTFRFEGAVVFAAGA